MLGEKTVVDLCCEETVRVYYFRELFEDAHFLTYTKTSLTDDAFDFVAELLDQFKGEQPHCDDPLSFDDDASVDLCE